MKTKAMTFIQWVGKNRRGLNKGYKKRPGCETYMGFMDWCSQFYAIYLEELFPA